MLHSIKSLKKSTLHASDGEVGKISDAYFDDQNWVVRHLVVTTGSWLSRQHVLLSPQSVESADWPGGGVHVNLTRERIEGSPDVATHEPVSRRSEAALAQHYGLPYYWSGGGGDKPMYSDAQLSTIHHDVDAGNPEDRHLQSCNDVSGYAIAATDDKVGHVVDFLFDDEDWSLQYLVVDPRDLWPGPHVLLPVERIEEVDWAGHKVTVSMRSDEVKNCPVYDADHLPPSRTLAQRAGTVGVASRPAPGL